MKQIRFFLFAAFAALAMVGCEQAEQVSKDTISNFGEEEITVSAKGGEALVSFKATAAWSATSSEEWIFIGQTSGEAGLQDVEINIEENTTNDVRSAIVTVKISESVYFNVLVSQEQNNVFSVSTKELTAPAEGGEVSFTVSTNVEFTVSPMASWIKVSSTKALENKTVTLSIEANEGAVRTSGVKVKSSEGEVLVKVSQECGATDQIGGAEFTYYGDYFGNGTANWVLQFYNTDILGETDGDKYYVYAIDMVLDSKYDFLYCSEKGIPDGTYIMDGSYAAGTLDEYTAILDYGAYDYIYPAEAELTVAGDVFSFVMTDEAGNEHKWTWTVDPEMMFYYDGSYASTVTDDYDITFDECSIQMFGQYFLDSGIETYQTYITFAGGNPQLGKEGVAEGTEGAILVSSATEDFVGTYTVQLTADQDFSAGKLDAYNSSFYSYDADEEYLEDGQFAFGGGTLTITKDGDEYVLEGSFIDDYPESYGDAHKLTIHARGTIAEEETEAASTRKVKGLSTKLNTQFRPMERKAAKYSIRF